MELLAKALRVDTQELLVGIELPPLQSMIMNEFVPLIGELEENEQEFFLKVLQLYLDMKSLRRDRS